jgi:hypothetical protein
MLSLSLYSVFQLFKLPAVQTVGELQRESERIVEKVIFVLKRLEHKTRSSLSSTGGPETDMSRPGIKPVPPRWETSTLAKRCLNSVLIAIHNIYI